MKLLFQQIQEFWRNSVGLSERWEKSSLLGVIVVAGKCLKVGHIGAYWV